MKLVVTQGNVINRPSYNHIVHKSEGMASTYRKEHATCNLSANYYLIENVFTKSKSG